jgi:hypothetical protein
MVDADTKVRLLREHCSLPDVQLYLARHGRAKSLNALAKMHPQLGGENGVQERLNEIEMTLQQAEREHELAAVGASSGADKLSAIAAASDAERDDNSGGVPIKSVPTGTLNGAGAGPAEPRSATTPPSRPAPAPSSGKGPSKSPGRERPSTPPPPSPPPATRPPATPRSWTSPLARRKHGEYDDSILNFLRAAGPRKQNDLCLELAVPRGSVTGIVDRLMREGKVVVRVAHGRKMVSIANPDAPMAPPPPKPTGEVFVTHEDLRGLITTARRDMEAMFDRLERLL